MNRYVRALSAVSLMVLLSPLLTFAAGEKKGEKETIFIAPLKVQQPVIEGAAKMNRLAELKRLSSSLESQLVSALNGTRVFQLMEQSRVPDVKPEQEAAAASAVSDDKKAAETGRTAGAKYAFMPRIDGFEDRSDIVEYRAIGRGSLNRRLFLSALVQVVDTDSGTVLPDSPSIQLSKSEVIENARIGQLAGSEEVLVALAREMAQKLSQEVVALLMPAKVLTVTGRVVMFNRGSAAGFAKGDLVEISTVQNVKDDDTGEMLRNELPVGQAVISRIEKYQSYATISGDDGGITKGCVVRFVKSAASRASEWEPPADVTLPDFGTKGDSGTTPGSSEKPLTWK